MTVKYLFWTFAKQSDRINWNLQNFHYVKVSGVRRYLFIAPILENYMP